MIVNVKIGGRWRGCKKTEKAFDMYAGRVINTMPRAGDVLKFKIPKEILLRPFYYKGPVAEIYGRAMYDMINGFVVAMAVDVCLREQDKGLWVVDHEMAHIVTAIKYGDWSHGNNFDKVLKVISNI